MKMKLFIVLILLLPFLTKAQLGDDKNKFTKADTLRGSLNENRDWWDVLRYEIEVKPDYEKKEIKGVVKLTFKYSDILNNPKTLIDHVLKGFNMQIDLQEPLVIDSILYYDSCQTSFMHGKKRDTYKLCQQQSIPKKVDGIYLYSISGSQFINKENRSSVIDSITIYYHGTPKEAKNAPWDGGWIWKTDSLGRPWMSVAVQGLGASAWFPCKDHQSDEPDNGASLTMIVPDSLIAIGNGRFISDMQFDWLDDEEEEQIWIDTSKDSRTIHHPVITTWEVKNPINSYNIVPYIGNYVNWTDTLRGEAKEILHNRPEHDPSGLDTIQVPKILNLSYWVLDYNLERAKQQFQQVKPMLRCFEYWFGPYPFYEDSYKLVESPHLGMEHQSAVAYGNKFRNGYLGRDRSGTGWGSKWDFIIIHESGHEWFANNITTKDIADMWVHEGFTNYSETLYTEWLFGKQAGDEYNKGLRRNIQNDKPIIGIYGVNQEGSGDMYDKAGNMIHIIRKVINDDEKFRKILRGMNEVFWHQTVTTQQIENYIIQQSGIDFQKSFDQYLRTTQIPQLEFYMSKDKKKISYRWTNTIKDFNLPLVINNKRYSITTKWKTTAITKDDLSRWNTTDIEKLYYITAKQVAKP
jgi:aminopeptidase N